ncbi:MarR family winged helix-turn-helix transcriptional regulator [Gynuella sp.]|uniref:MarR family winged helix-turn-helix transcriptional regulator n=1 Tax=Gynuella sp. TaxID=2969146 RepID=UPI003D0E0D86
MSTQVSDSVDKIRKQWSTERPELELLPMELIGRMSRIYKRGMRLLEECHLEFDLKPGEFDVLATLRRSGAPHTLTPSELFQSMMLSSGAMTNRLDKLEQKGLISRSHSHEDRRSVTVTLTDKGLALINQAVTAHLQTQALLLSELTQDQQQQLNQLLKNWLISLEQSP